MLLSDPEKRELYDQLGETEMLAMEDPFAAKDVSKLILILILRLIQGKHQRFQSGSRIILPGM